MEAFLAEIESTALVQYLRFGQWGYAVVNTTHIIGIALLVGAIVPLDLRLLGLWSDASRTTLVRVLVPVAATGLAIAMAAGMVLFSVKALDYAYIWLMQLKLILVATGATAAILLHAREGWLLERASDSRLAGHAALSITCWFGALVCGRFIAFLPE